MQWQLLPNTLGGPLSGLVISATHAELDELRHGVLLLMVVIGLHQHQLLSVLTGSLSILLIQVGSERLAIDRLNGDGNLPKY